MKFSKFFVTFVFTTLCTAVYAGSSRSVPVEIDLEERSASGNMLTARLSANENELIGCGVRTSFFPGEDVFSYGFCSAKLDGELSIVCITENAQLVEAIAAIDDYSYITFDWDEDLNCTFIGSSTQSFYLPTPN